MLTSGNSVLEAFPVYTVYRLTLKRCGKIIAVRFSFMISGYHDSRKLISL